MNTVLSSNASDKVRVKTIWKENDRTLGIEWTDGRRDAFDVVELRRRCSCAGCIDEWTGERRLAPSDVPESTRPVRLSSVGRYALSIQFDDGHGSGIYTFPMLRQMNARSR
jgi:DUF971 family protein